MKTKRLNLRAIDAKDAKLIATWKNSSHIELEEQEIINEEETSDENDNTEENDENSEESEESEDTESK